jgi:hypothetical protein
MADHRQHIGELNHAPLLERTNRSLDHCCADRLTVCTLFLEHEAMKAKPVFTARDKQFNDIGQVEFIPLIYTAGTVTHRLALHRETGSLPDSMKEWRISHPTIGASVCRVLGSHKGMPCSSRGMGLRDARMHAVACLDAMLERIGSDRFNDTIATQLEQFNLARIEAIREKIYDEHATGLDS